MIARAMRRACTLLLLASMAPLACAQRTSSTLQVGADTLTIEWTPTALRGRTAARELRPGTVWRMSRDEPPLLTTPIPLLTGGVVIPPGATRLSARYLGERLWSIVMFRDANLFHEQVAYDEVPVVLRDEPVAQEMLDLALSSTDGAVELTLRWGRHSLRQQLVPLQLVSHEGRFLGEPATFTFYSVPAGDDVMRVLRERQLRIGDVQQSGGARLGYAIEACCRDGDALCLRFRDLTATRLARDLQLARDEQTRLAQMLEAADGERRERVRERLTAVETTLAGLEQAQAARTGLLPDAELTGTLLDVAAADPALLTAIAEPDGEQAKIRATFAGRTTEFLLGPDFPRAHQGRR